MEASPYVRLFGLASSNNITASLKEYEANPPAILNQIPEKQIELYYIFTNFISSTNFNFKIKTMSCFHFAYKNST